MRGWQPLPGGEEAVSGDWIVVAVITVLLVIVTAYSVFLSFRSGTNEKSDHREDERPEPEAGPKPGRKAA